MKAGLARLWCAIWGHDRMRLPSPPGVMGAWGGWGGPWKCQRCPASFDGYRYPPMPPVKPSKGEPEIELTSASKFRSDPPAPPEPPPARRIMDGVGGVCLGCGSSATRKWFIFGANKCIRPECEYEASPHGSGANGAPHRKDVAGTYLSGDARRQLFGDGRAPDAAQVAFVAERAALEQRLIQRITAELDEFTARTGATVIGIEVGIVDVTQVGEPTDHMVASVRVVTPFN